MKTLLLILTIALSSQLMAEGYNAAKAHEDSVFIYQTYKDQISFLENAAKQSNYQGWYSRSYHDDSITTCAKVRLKKWNKKDYEMVDTREFEGFGTAYLFPDPTFVKSGTVKGEPAPVVTTAPVKKIKFSILDAQTKFVTRPDGKTKIPYVEKINYDEKGMVVSVEQLYSMR